MSQLPTIQLCIPVKELPTGNPHSPDRQKATPGVMGFLRPLTYKDTFLVHSPFDMELPPQLPSYHSKGQQGCSHYKMASLSSLPPSRIYRGRRVFGAFPALLGQLPGPCSQDTCDWGSLWRGGLPVERSPPRLSASGICALALDRH